MSTLHHRRGALVPSDSHGNLFFVEEQEGPFALIPWEDYEALLQTAEVLLDGMHDLCQKMLAPKGVAIHLDQNDALNLLVLIEEQTGEQRELTTEAEQQLLDQLYKQPEEEGGKP